MRIRRTYKRCSVEGCKIPAEYTCDLNECAFRKLCEALLCRKHAKLERFATHHPNLDPEDCIGDAS
jgi:hypothetical protein